MKYIAAELTVGVTANNGVCMTADLANLVQLIKAYK
jgi:hypothetical protein